MRAGIEIGAWVVKIGSSRPSSGICHQVSTIEGDVLRHRCGISMNERDVFDVVAPDKQGRCLRCSAAIMASRVKSGRLS